MRRTFIVFPKDTQQSRVSPIILKSLHMISLLFTYDHNLDFQKIITLFFHEALKSPPMVDWAYKNVHSINQSLFSCVLVVFFFLVVIIVFVRRRKVLSEKCIKRRRNCSICYSCLATYRYTKPLQRLL